MNSKSTFLVSACVGATLLWGCGAQKQVGPQAPLRPEATAAKDEAKPYITQGVDALKAGDIGGARTLFEIGVQKNPKSPEAHHYLGVVLEHQLEKAGAEKEYLAALTLDPQLIESAQNLAAIYVDSERYDDAVALCRSVLNKAPKSPGLLINYAVALAMKGDEAASRKVFEDAIALQPNEVAYYISYAQALANWQHRDEALVKLRGALSIAGDDPVMLGSVGFEFRQTVRSAPDCIMAFDLAIAAKDNADFRTNRALCKIANKDVPGALLDLREATTKEPSFAPAHYWFANTLHDEGKFPEAASEYERYLKVAPNGTFAKAAQTKIALAKAKKKSPRSTKP